MDNKRYNGWTNYETWVTKLWLDNSEADQEIQRELAKQAIATPKADVWTREETNKYTLADLLKDHIEDTNPLRGDANLYSDLMSAALQEIDWAEIAEAILEDWFETNK